MLAVNHLIKTALSCDKPSPRCAYLAPLRNQAKQIAWDYVKQYARPIPGTAFNESELRADFPNGARLTLYGCDNPDTLRGIYLDAVVLDEYAQMPPRVWGPSPITQAKACGWGSNPRLSFWPAAEAEPSTCGTTTLSG